MRYDDDPEHYSDDGPHSHPCLCCKTPVECRGELMRNFDGWPEMICFLYHECNIPLICESCYVAQQRDACHDCGEPGCHVFEDAADASGYKGEIVLCVECLEKRRQAA